MAANRYELRSLHPKRMRYPIDYQESRQLLSPPPHVKRRKVVPWIKGGFGNGMSSEEAEYLSILRDKLSDSGHENADEGSEASAEQYAMMAVDRLKRYGNFELVVAGPIAVGNASGGCVFQLNYKAKNIDVPGAEVQTFFTEMTKTKKDGVIIHSNFYMGPSNSLSGAKVQTFFTELTTTKKDGVTIHSTFCLGPSNLLPEKANTQDCLYCLSCNIHHPPHGNTFRSGGLQLWKTLWSEVCRLDKCMKKGMKKKQFCPKFKHPGIVYVGKKVVCTKADYANAALRMFNLEQHTNFELVRIGDWDLGNLKIGFVFHLNFEAKRKDDPEAPMHTFFAQVIRNCGYVFAHFCKCLGQSDSLPDEIELHGCLHCMPLDSSCSPRVRHPPGPGYLIGRELYGS